MQSADASQNHLVYLARIKCESGNESAFSLLPDQF